MNEFNYLAVDFGKNRIGLAVANSLSRLASPLKIIDSSSAIEAVSEMAREYQVLVVGSPRDMNGNYGEMADLVKAWYEDLMSVCRGKSIALDFVLFDETLSSVRARELARDLGRGQRDHIDDLAAAIILQDYLDQTR